MILPYSITARIAQSHIHYAKRLSNCVELPYGLMFHDTKNPQSHMCNHAVITDLSGDLDDKVGYVTDFYREKGLTPVIYTGFQRKSFHIMSQPLVNHGYSLGRYPEGQFMYYPNNKPLVLPDSSVCVRRVTKPDEELLHMFPDDEEGLYNRLVISKLLPKKEYFLFSVYDQGKPVAVASMVRMSKFKTCVIDNVYTVPAYRNNGYATAIVQHALNARKAYKDHILFLYAFKEQPVRIYQKIGFVKATGARLEYWNAWC